MTTPAEATHGRRRRQGWKPNWDSDPRDGNDGGAAVPRFRTSASLLAGVSIPAPSHLTRDLVSCPGDDSCVSVTLPPHCTPRKSPDILLPETVKLPLRSVKFVGVN